MVLLLFADRVLLREDNLKLTEVDFTRIPGKKGRLTAVRAGDMVDLLPASSEFPDGKGGRFLPEAGRNFLLRKIGRPGPYKVVRIYRGQRDITVELDVDGRIFPIRRTNLQLA